MHLLPKYAHPGGCHLTCLAIVEGVHDESQHMTGIVNRRHDYYVFVENPGAPFVFDRAKQWIPSPGMTAILFQKNHGLDLHMRHQRSEDGSMKSYAPCSNISTLDDFLNIMKQPH